VIECQIRGWSLVMAVLGWERIPGAEPWSFPGELRQSRTEKRKQTEWRHKAPDQVRVGLDMRSTG
jgi:hypothetical protein